MMNDWITEQLERLIRWLDRTFNIVEHNEDDNAYYAWADTRLDELAAATKHKERVVNSICKCGLARSYHDGRLRSPEEYRPRYP